MKAVPSVPLTREQIARLKLFQGIPYERIAPTLSACPVRRLEPGDVLLDLGQANHDLFLLLCGRLQVQAESGHTGFGIGIEAGEFVGEMSVIDGQPTSAFVVAELDSEVLVISDTCLWHELAPVPGITRNLLRLVCDRMRTGTREMFAAHRQQQRMEELEKELAHARGIQANMLPHQWPLLADFHSLDVHALMEPAKEVGGDFYDAFALNSAHACVVVGDVSGKGMSAALFMVRALTLFRAEARAGDTIDAIVERLNTALSVDNEACMFVTLCAAVINVETGDTAIVCAGHDAPVARMNAAPWTLLTKPRGSLVGVMEPAGLSTARLRLSAGDMLMLYTDGVTEAECPRRSQYSVARLLQDLDCGQPDNATAAVECVRARVAAHAGNEPQSDDITLLALRYCPEAR